MIVVILVYLGNIGIHGGYLRLMVHLTDCDVMISIGTRFNDRITGKLSTFAQNCKIIHIDVDAASISKILGRYSNRSRC